MSAKLQNSFDTTTLLEKKLQTNKYFQKNITTSWVCRKENKFGFSCISQNLIVILHTENITLNKNIMNAVIERTPRSVTVRMSTKRWNRMLELEQTYKLARIISRSMNEVESEPSMTPQEAIDSLKAL